MHFQNNLKYTASFITLLGIIEMFKMNKCTFFWSYQFSKSQLTAIKVVKQSVTVLMASRISAESNVLRLHVEIHMGDNLKTPC